jgi:hypothetical protein
VVRPKFIRPLAESSYVRGAIVSASGFGKTVFCGTAPRALFLTTDPEGTISAKAFGSTAQEWQISSLEQLRDAYVYMAKEGCREFDWLIHDNASEEQALFMNASIAARVARKGAQTDPLVPEQADYQRQQNGIIQITKQFRDLPINQLWTVHRTVKTTEDEEGEDVEYYSCAIHGKEGAIAEQFLGMMNIIGYGEVITKNNKEIRRIYFDHVRKYRGKDRYGKLGRYQDNLTVPRMMELLEGRSPARRPARKAAIRRTTTTRRAS